LTIRFTTKNQDKMRRSVETFAPQSAKISCVSRKPFLENRKKALDVNSWKIETVRVTAPYKEVPKLTKQSKITSFFSSSTTHITPFDYLDKL
jgi:hypothetical protein